MSLWNPKVNFDIHKSLTLVHTLSQLNTVQNFTYYFYQLLFNIILLTVPMFSEWFIPFDKPPVRVHLLYHVNYMLCPSPPPWLYHYDIWRRVGTMKLLVTHCCAASCCSVHLGSNYCPYHSLLAYLTAAGFFIEGRNFHFNTCNQVWKTCKIMFVVCLLQCKHQNIWCNTKGKPVLLPKSCLNQILNSIYNKEKIMKDELLRIILM